jgi:lysozyme family protein
MIPVVALAWVCLAEGVQSNAPADRGGLTIGGIAHAQDTLTFLDWARRYEHDYWLAVRCPELPIRLALCVFDAAVNTGPKQAVVTLQQTLLVVPGDGQFGTQTMQALQAARAAHGDRELETAYLDRRDIFYDRLVAHDPTQAVFRVGWANRLTRLKKYLDFVESLSSA